MVSFSSIPVSLANAFEDPINNQSGFLKPSISALQNYWKQTHQGYGLKEQVATFQLGESKPLENLTVFSSLPELETWVCKDAGVYS